MNTDDAIAHTRALGWRVWSLSEQTSGTGWRARLYHPERSRFALGKPGFSDAWTDFGEGATPAEAILNAAEIQIDRKTGLVARAPAIPTIYATRLADAVSAALEARR
jgi:hypothetical protein